MKSRWDNDEFNPPEEMLIRALFLVCLAGFTAGVILTVGGAGFGSLKVTGGGVALLVIAGLIRTWLHRSGKFEQAEGALQRLAEAGPAVEGARVDELVGLLRQWNAIERTRGTPAFDPWALQAVRHDIRITVETDPALERLFHENRRAA